jgi:alpha/beta superfamily hydrolase
MKTIKKISSTFFIILLITGWAAASGRESTVCGSIKEPLLFLIWSSAAPYPDESRVSSLKYVQNIQFITSDKKKLNGYVYRAHDKKKGEIPAKGYILVALGNAMISNQMIKYFKGFSEKGYDVYVYDYRGYGSSEGKRRINAFIEDYKEIIVSLNQKYDRHMLYGISIGGVVIMNAIGSGIDYDSAVIDSTPSRLSPFGCPEKIDPINNLPEDAKKILVITGHADQVLKPAMTSEFRLAAQKNNAKVFDGKEYAHPFMDRSPDIHHDRMALTIRFLSGGSEGN